MNYKHKFLTILAIIAMMSINGSAQKKQGESNMKVVSTDWVAEHFNDQDVRILDMRVDPHDYFAGHVPNAVHLADASLRAA